MEDTNKHEETIRQIDELIPERIDLTKLYEAKEKELNDTKAYLEIVLSDLADAKQNSKHIVKKRRNAWKYIALLQTVFIISFGVIFTVYMKHKETIPVMDAQEAQDDLISNEETGLLVETKRLHSDLTTLVKEMSALESDFQPMVTTLFGFEYLMFTNGEIQIYYRNEVPADGSNYRQKIMIDNGSRIAEFDWDYNLLDGIESLYPQYGTFFNNNEEQLIFTIYDKEKSTSIPKELRAVSATNLWEHEPIDLKGDLSNLFAASYEEVGNNENNLDMRMKLTFGSSSYTYAIGKEDYINAVYYEENLIKLEDHFRLNFDDNVIRIQTIPYLSEQEYLGELTTTVGLHNNTLHLTDTKYSAYVTPDQEDVEREGVIVPRSEVLSEDRIQLWGRNGQSYLIELSKLVERNTITQEDLLLAEDGRYSLKKGNQTSIPGIDVSKFQEEIDWKQVKQAGVEFAIIRVGFRGFNEGTLEVDPYFEQNIKGAIEAGIHVGVYFFSQAITIEEAKEEAEFVLEQIKDYKITYPVIIDTEYVTTYAARANRLSRQLRTDIVKTFCELVKQSGYHPMIYSNTKWMVMGIDLEQLQEYDRWFAYYGNNLNFPYHFDMLQYSDQGTIPGIKGDVDLNISFIDYSKFQGTGNNPKE